MPVDISVKQVDQRRPAEDDVCPLHCKSLKTDDHSIVFRLDTKSLTGSPHEEERAPVPGGGMMGEEAVAMETWDSSEDELGRLDIDLDRKSKRHNLTSQNVRAILHEVITHEHVVAMMKAAIRDTQDLPMFEQKMTRSRLRQVVQQGQPLTWSLSAVTAKPRQFVDIDLEEDDDSSDEEYCPDEEEEEEDTVDENFLSDADCWASPPRIHQEIPHKLPDEQMADHPQQNYAGLPRDLALTTSCAPQHLLTALEPSFLDRLNAVEEELDSSPAYAYNQAAADEGCLAFRTRSRLPLVNVPLGQLEAELLAPDITADMYDQSAVQRLEDPHWTQWLQGLMAPDNEEEADDDDDPEYNVLDDLDEPDLEDYRTDRAVQITKKEVNELLEELFDTLQEEEEEEEEAAADEEEEDIPLQTGPKFNVPQALYFDAPLAGMLTERRRTVRKQYEALQQRRALQDSTSRHHEDLSPPPHTATPVIVLPDRVYPTLILDCTQKLQLQQQIQQHVQLLTQVHLLSRRVDGLNHEACITKQYLEELQQFSLRREAALLPSNFRVSNLQWALDLLQEVEQREEPRPTSAYRRWLPRMTPATSSHAFPLLPADTAWLLATRPVFLYPELLPVCSLDPALHSRHQRSVYTAGEDGLIVLGLKHFEGTVELDQLISSYLLCKNRWNLRKHIRDMSSQRAPPSSVIKVFLRQGVIPPLPLACSRAQPGDQLPPVDRDSPNAPNWLKNSRQIILKTRLNSGSYPPSLPPGCTLRLHPYWLNKSRPPVPPPRRLFTLAHNASLLPLAKAPSLPLAPPPLVHGTTPCLPIGQSVAMQQNMPFLPLLRTQSAIDTLTPIMPSAVTAATPGCLLIQMVLVEPTAGSQHALGWEEDRAAGEESSASASTLSPPSLSGEREEGGEREECGGEREADDGGRADDGGEREDDNGGRKDNEGEGEHDGQREEGGGERDDDDGGKEDDGQREEAGGEREDDDGEREDDDGEREEDGGERDEDQDRQEEEEEDFDDLTQDEDEEEVMSSASEESVLSVPELQETMKQLTWLAAERRLCADGDSEEDHSPTSEEEDEGGHKGVGLGQGRCGKGGDDDETPSGEGTPRGVGGRCPGRGRGRSRPLRGLRRSRQERHSKDSAKLLLLYDEKLLENDPHRESKDMAFAQSYLTRVREALQDIPGQVEEFVSLLNEFEQVGEGEDVVSLFRRLRRILGDRTDLLRDFAAFLHPEQALECGLFEEQQVFDRSRRFLRQLEISFGDNPSHYQKIIKALQTGQDLSPHSIQELKAQMATLLKGHTHLQAEFWVFFDELRPPPARPGQFEEAHWHEEGGGGSDGGELGGLVSLGVASGGFEEVTLPELDEEDEGNKIQPMTSRRCRRKIDAHRSYKGCDWSDKDWPCSCHDVKIRRHRRKRCSRCHGNKTTGGVSRAMKSLDPLYSQISSSNVEPGEKDLDLKGDDDSPQPDRSSASWEGPFPLMDEKDEEEELCEEEEEEDEDEEERKGSEKEQSLAVKRSRREEALQPLHVTSSAPPELSVCAKNISLTASGERVILWTREADRVILTTCQQEGANQNTFQAISTLLGNKTPIEVSRRFRDLMRLFRTAARQTSSEDEAPPTDPAAATQEDSEELHEQSKMFSI